ncbi:N-acetylmuramoyl-L-alanine amidase [Rariglobus hedericola]|uniref:1,6-anhydro-N-acetylmuramyl-L-alanine amidase AmpD n=1 Tax=Rariglobus hedericola TaxID=2597822 RepID=A0A556QS55_9BACT|nr:N-acetylmuramoyl-L-alanine amidase [Rariglobus hedericola]TSJ79476.1 nucleoside transporter [Rariglobus hedericola]
MPSFTEIRRPSPNFSATPAHEKLGVCFHHSVMDFEATILHMLSPESRVSYHVLIGADGTRATLVPDDHVAWHAGVSSFHGRNNCNAFLLGVSFAVDTRTTPLTTAQIASALDWLAPRWLRHGWTPACMTDHRQVAPGRKDDLAPREWLRLLAAISEHFLPVV